MTITLREKTWTSVSKKKGFKKMVSLEAKQDWSSSPLV